MEKQKARIWIFCRNLESLQSTEQQVKENLASWPVSENVVNNANGIVKAFKDFCSYMTLTKHWAVIVEYLDEDGTVDVTEIYEANDNGEGILVATNQALTKKEKKTWAKLPGVDIYTAQHFF